MEWARCKEQMKSEIQAQRVKNGTWYRFSPTLAPNLARKKVPDTFFFILEPLRRFGFWRFNHKVNCYSAMTTSAFID